MEPHPSTVQKQRTLLRLRGQSEGLQTWLKVQLPMRSLFVQELVQRFKRVHFEKLAPKTSPNLQL